MKWFDYTIIIALLTSGVAVGSSVWLSPENITAGHSEMRIVLTCVALSVATVSAYLALRNMFINTRNREADIKWKRSEAARDMLEKLFADEEANNALRMLEDEPDENFTYEDATFAINLKNVRKGLEDWGDGTKQSRLVRKSFDSLASYLVRLRYFVLDGLVSLNVVRPVFRYHAMRMAQEKQAISQYFMRIGHDDAVIFLELFDEWQRPTEFGPVDMLQDGKSK